MRRRRANCGAAECISQADIGTDKGETRRASVSRWRIAGAPQARPSDRSLDGLGAAGQDQPQNSHLHVTSSPAAANTAAGKASSPVHQSAKALALRRRRHDGEEEEEKSQREREKKKVAERPAATRRHPRTRSTAGTTTTTATTATRSTTATSSNTGEQCRRGIRRGWRCHR